MAILSLQSQTVATLRLDKPGELHGAPFPSPRLKTRPSTVNVFGDLVDSNHTPGLFLVMLAVIRGSNPRLK